jgi:prepilin-type N-terminal cleavage/methylation domain-containing protein/prepilin-type processing-associated H-X9-DG protein
MKKVQTIKKRSTQGFTLIELLVVIAIVALVSAIIFPVIFRVRENGRSSVCISNMRQLGSAVTMYIQDYDETYPMNRIPDAKHPLQVCQLGGKTPGMDGSSLNWRRVTFPYVKNLKLYECPSNGYAWVAPAPGIQGGDESNPEWPASQDHFPLSYAYNGSFFHESTPCNIGEALQRPRRATEIRDSSHLLLLLETRMSLPDLGSWSLTWAYGNDKSHGVFQVHNGIGNFVFVDGHAASIKLAATCDNKYWSDGYPDPDSTCNDLPTELFAEYR